MQSNNPVFRNSDEFNGRASNAYGNQVYGGSGRRTRATALDRARPVHLERRHPGTPTHPGRSTGPMTIDSVVQKTGLSLLVVLVAAFATWVLTPALGAAGSTLSHAAISSSPPRWRSAASAPSGCRWSTPSSG